MFFEYNLPEHLIAHHPAARRDESRLLVVRRGVGRIEHHTFRDLPALLDPGDLLVLNDTRVLPARLVGQRVATGGKWEGLYLGQKSDGLWEMLGKTRGYPEVGSTFITNNGSKLTLCGRTRSAEGRGFVERQDFDDQIPPPYDFHPQERHWLMQPDQEGSPLELLSRYGQVPLPPYIRKGQATKDDEDRYQTVFADRAGSVAAPTAGLHFSAELFDRLAARGVEIARVTLHVGLGTFAPVKVDDPLTHTIHREWCEVAQTTVEAINAARERRSRVVAIGTTTTRTLETAARPDGLKPFSGETGLYIHAPFEFRVVDGLVTNFHLPRTTLLLLVGAFAGSELFAAAYNEAIASGYRFYSYGDAMLVLP